MLESVEMRNAPKGVEEYLARVPEPARGALKKVRAAIQAVVPEEATETISYGMPMFRHEGMLLGYAAFKNHCSLFPGPGVILEYREDLKSFQTSRGTIRFSPDNPLPATLVKKLVRARIAENKRKRIGRKSTRMNPNKKER